jgi:hypothetical protein
MVIPPTIIVGKNLKLVKKADNPQIVGENPKVWAILVFPIDKYSITQFGSIVIPISTRNKLENAITISVFTFFCIRSQKERIIRIGMPMLGFNAMNGKRKAPDDHLSFSQSKITQVRINTNNPLICPPNKVRSVGRKRATPTKNGIMYFIRSDFVN